MLIVLKNLAALFVFRTACAQADIMPIRPGSQTDTHGCVADGGYQWCEASQRCQRVWEEPCVAVAAQPIAIAPCPKTCPPPAPCPMPEMMANHCIVVPSGTDHCGCTIGCPSIDCSHPPIAQSGDTCGGYMVAGMAAVCDSGLECVTMEPMVADAPGSCMPICEGSRDRYGNCIGATTIPQIPRNCVTWYDGCNTCSTVNGQLGGCTMMMCFEQNEPYCQAFAATDLQVGDICYRFCEDGSQSFVDLRDKCPSVSQCDSHCTSPDYLFISKPTMAHTDNLIRDRVLCINDEMSNPQPSYTMSPPEDLMSEHRLFMNEEICNLRQRLRQKYEELWAVTEVCRHCLQLFGLHTNVEIHKDPELRINYNEVMHVLAISHMLEGRIKLASTSLPTLDHMDLVMLLNDYQSAESTCAEIVARRTGFEVLRERLRRSKLLF